MLSLHLNANDPSWFIQLCYGNERRVICPPPLVSQTTSVHSLVASYLGENFERRMAIHKSEWKALRKQKMDDEVGIWFPPTHFSSRRAAHDGTHASFTM